MISDLKWEANRANALLSTGPRTSAGKQRSRLNARRHGLAQDVLTEPSLRPQIEALAATLTDAVGAKGVASDARSAAAAQIDLLRIRKVQSHLLNELSGAPPDGRDAIQRQLNALQRYERRAYSRRRKAFNGLLQSSRHLRGALNESTT